MDPWPAARALIGAVLLAAAVGKLRDRRTFAEFVASLRAVPVVPAVARRVTATVVVALETTMPFLLAADRTARGGMLVAAVLFAAFAVGIAATLHGGGTAQCRCFGGAGTPLRRRHLVRAVLLAGASALGAWAAPPTADGALLHPAALLPVTAGLLGAAVVVRFDDLHDLFTS